MASPSERAERIEILKRIRNEGSNGVSVRDIDKPVIKGMVEAGLIEKLSVQCGNDTIRLLCSIPSERLYLTKAGKAALELSNG